MDSDLYSEATVLMYFSKSANKPVGKGAFETIQDSDIPLFKKLEDICNWRQKLSNFYMRPNRSSLFVLDSKKWASVEHYFHAQKFKSQDPTYSFSFSLNSGSPLSKALGPVVKNAGRAKQLTNTRRQEWEKQRNKVLYDAFLAKFGQNDDLKGRQGTQS
jgi:predicted NAD-dependent protein-ADP-ribosyltransferase YbiA (DUF1768 family)